jgi:hypothetical protein
MFLFPKKTTSKTTVPSLKDIVRVLLTTKTHCIMSYTHQDPATKKSYGCLKTGLFTVLGLYAIYFVIGLISAFNQADSEWDESYIEQARDAYELKDYSYVKMHLDNIKTDSFKAIALAEFPDIDLLITKENTPPFRIVEIIRFPKNQAGINAAVSTVLVDSLYFDEIQTVVLESLRERFDDEKEAHQVYLHKSSPKELAEVSKSGDKNKVLQVAKKGAFAYFIKTLVDDGLLMGVDKKGNYIDYE